MAQYLYIWVGAYWFSATSLSKWPPGGHIGFFGFRTNFEYQLQTSVAKYLCIRVRAYWFSVTSLSKWLPGGHIRFFGFWMAWFRQRNSSLLWNFSFKFDVHVRVAVGRSLTIVSYVAFKMAALWFWTMPPSPMGRGYPSRSLIYNF